MMTADFCDNISNMMMAEEGNMEFLLEIVRSQEQMTGLASAASRMDDAVLQSSALWALGIMMAADSAEIKGAAYEVARDNPLDAACAALSGDDAEMAKCAAYFLHIMTSHATEYELSSICSALRSYAAGWFDKAAVYQNLHDAVYRLGMHKPTAAPLSVAMAIFNAAQPGFNRISMAKAIGNIAAESSQAIAISRNEAMTFLSAAAKALQGSNSNLFAKELCWAISNLACDGDWADWIYESPMYRCMLYRDPETAYSENVVALANIVESSRNHQHMCEDAVLRAVLKTYAGRVDISRALSRIGLEDKRVPSAIELLGYAPGIITPTIQRCVNALASASTATASVPPNIVLTLAERRQMSAMGYEIEPTGYIRIAPALLAYMEPDSDGEDSE
jgi:hypothetical protein